MSQVLLQHNILIKILSQRVINGTGFIVNVIAQPVSIVNKHIHFFQVTNRYLPEKINYALWKVAYSAYTPQAIMSLLGPQSIEQEDSLDPV